MSDVEYQRVEPGQYVVTIGVTLICGVKKYEDGSWHFYVHGKWSDEGFSTRKDAHYAAVRLRRSHGWEG